MRLEGKIALVTGSGRGLGKAIALLFAEEGAKVIVNSLHQETSDATVKEIKAAGGEAVAIVRDIGITKEAQALVQGAIDTYGGLDILVNNAGMHLDNFVQNMTEEQWDRVIDVNLKGTFMCLQAAARHMIERKSGKIVNISSLAAQGQIGGMNYIASKGGIDSMTKAAALELARFNINVNAIEPFCMDTDLMREFSDKLKERTIARIPLRRWAEPREVAQTALFLASEESKYIIGQCIVVDGGTTVYLLQ